MSKYNTPLNIPPLRSSVDRLKKSETEPVHVNHLAQSDKNNHIEEPKPIQQFEKINNTEDLNQTDHAAENNTSVSEKSNYLLLEKEKVQKETKVESTFINLIAVDGIIEGDLISYRVKGVEQRFLKIKLLSPTKEGDYRFLEINIDNKEDFDVLKNFFSKINWED